VSTHYLIDLFSDGINGVVTPRDTPPTSLVTGNYIVRVDDDVQVEKPTDLSDLLTKKYQGILGTHGLFTQIAYDDLLDASNIDFTTSRGIFSGLKGHIGIYPMDSTNPAPILQTSSFGITWGGPVPGPQQAMVVYELFTFVDEDSSTAPFQRSYQEVPTDVDVLAEISFNGGASFTAFQNNSLVTIPSFARGTQVVLRFTRTSTVSSVAKVFFGSWAVLY
jgi:hypothetical protein